MSIHYKDEATVLHHGDALEIARELESGSADCIVTSPPYFGLRDYGDPNQWGLESKPAEYVEKLRALFSELRRVLADDGTFWLNLGDTYGRGNKQLLGIPWRVAFALQDDGWILRNDIVWSKRNCMPDPTRDRLSRNHEMVFLFSKTKKYHFDKDAVRELPNPKQQAHNARYAKEYDAHTDRAAVSGQPGNVNNVGIHSRVGANAGSARTVWNINTTPFPEAHFATFPVALPDRCIKAGCKPGGTVLDPFSGSGTTGKAALATGRKYVGIDVNADYLDLSLRTRLEPALTPFVAAEEG